MRGFGICLLLMTLSVSVSTQKTAGTLNPENKLFIITLDGFRWEEVFGGADSALLRDTEVTKDTAIAKALFWDSDPRERRRKLLPFFWNVLAQQGQLYGNRAYQNKVNVSNPYALSYPGYSELLTGTVDLSIYGNGKKRNRNRNILQTLNSTEAYAGKVAAFTSWDAFPYILDKETAGFVLNSGHESIRDAQLSAGEAMVNAIQEDVITEKEETRYDELTYIACKEYVMKHKPSVVFLSFSGTDDAGHSRRYDQYLEKAANADRMIGELWKTLQGMPEYAGKTSFLITTDHGRGGRKGNWHKHGFFVPGSSQAWMAMMGKGIVPAGEMKGKNQVYHKELKEMITLLLSR